jgi:hypothetical protein
MRDTYRVTVLTCCVDAESDFRDTVTVGKSPETVPAKVLKNRENKIRRDAARQDLRLVKLHRDGLGHYLLFVASGRGLSIAKDGSSNRVGNNQLTLDEVVAALRLRQLRRPQEL